MRIRELKESLATAIVTPQTFSPEKAQDDPRFETLLRSLRGLRDNIELDRLNAEELRSVKNFLHLVVLTSTMTWEGCKRHISAAYTATVKQALLHLSLGPMIIGAINQIVGAPAA